MMRAGENARRPDAQNVRAAFRVRMTSPQGSCTGVPDTDATSPVSSTVRQVGSNWIDRSTSSWTIGSRRCTRCRIASQAVRRMNMFDPNSGGRPSAPVISVK